MRLILEPDGWPVPLRDCRPGLFLYEERIGLKTEYAAGDILDIFTQYGEFFRPVSTEHLGGLRVQPVKSKWERK